MKKFNIAAMTCFLLATGGAACAATAPASRALPPGILSAIGKSSARGERPVAIFDIDDTIISTGDYNLQILREFLGQADTLLDFPAESALIYSYKLSQKDVMVSPVPGLRRRGFGNEKFLSRLEAFWKPRYKNPGPATPASAIPGAPGYLNAVAASGGTVIYLTARAESLREFTLSQLRQFGFPLPGGNVYLLMKQDPAQDNTEYKRMRFAEIAAMGKVIAAFDNEPKNVNALKNYFRDSAIVFINTACAGEKDSSGNPITPNQGILWADDFR